MLINNPGNIVYGRMSVHPLSVHLPYLLPKPIPDLFLTQKVMTLIASVSGIRGTIGGSGGLSADVVLRYTGAMAQWICQNHLPKKVVVGRDARPSGRWILHLVKGMLQSMGIDVVDLGCTTTPTLQLMVTDHQAGGGIMISASHNPAGWNALKLLNRRGEFLTLSESQVVKELATHHAFVHAPEDNIGSCATDTDAIQKHIEKILQLSLVDKTTIQKRAYRVVVDCINSSGALCVPPLLSALGAQEVITLNHEPNGLFAHMPEPLPEHLTTLADQVVQRKADVGFAVDPDVDRLAIVCEDGSLFGEEYTLVAVADYVLRRRPGNTVSNLSSSRALKDVAEKYGCNYFSSPVGEVHVVARMKEVGAVIGGEGNGGVIFPELHYGRDALVGIALFLSALATSGTTCSALRAALPSYVLIKKKLHLPILQDGDRILEALRRKYATYPMNTEDGLRIDFEQSWVHLRRSNTEPIVRIYAESPEASTAEELVNQIMADIHQALTI